MKVLLLANNKGGVGKTTISRAITEYFAFEKNKKVLAIDMDPQGNFSNRFLDMVTDPEEPEGKMPPIHPDHAAISADGQWNGISSIADIYFSNPVIPYPTHIPNLDIIPAHSAKMLEAEALRKSELAEKVTNRLHEFLVQPDIWDIYDIVIIDTSPSKGPLTVSAFRAATHLLIPTVMEPQPIEGVYGMLQLWIQTQMSRDESFPLELIGIIANMYDQRTSLHRQFYAQLKDNPETGKFMLPYKIGKRIVFAESDAQGARPPSIIKLPASNEARIEVVDICALAYGRIFTPELTSNEKEFMDG